MSDTCAISSIWDPCLLPVTLSTVASSARFNVFQKTSEEPCLPSRAQGMSKLGWFSAINWSSDTETRSAWQWRGIREGRQTEGKNWRGRISPQAVLEPSICPQLFLTTSDSKISTPKTFKENLVKIVVDALTCWKGSFYAASSSIKMWLWELQGAFQHFCLHEEAVSSSIEQELLAEPCLWNRLANSQATLGMVTKVSWELQNKDVERSLYDGHAGQTKRNWGRDSKEKQNTVTQVMAESSTSE